MDMNTSLLAHIAHVSCTGVLAGSTSARTSSDFDNLRKCTAPRYSGLDAIHGRSDGMTSDIDILRTAQSLIRTHGDDAEIVAAQRADEYLSAGDRDGLVLSQRVLAAIRELRRTSPKPGESKH